MPLHFTAAHSSRIQKRPQGRNPLLKRSSSSSFSTLSNRRKSSLRSDSEYEDTAGWAVGGDHLEDVGLVKTLAADTNSKDVVQAIMHIHSNMFEPLPESGGFNSTAIARILNYRRNLPPILCASHLHASMVSSTKIERELSDLTRSGTVQKLQIPGRGMGHFNIGDGLALTDDIGNLLGNDTTVEKDLGNQFKTHLEQRQLIPALKSGVYTIKDVHILRHAGFLTARSAISHISEIGYSYEQHSLGTEIALSSVAQAASGSLAAVGGADAIASTGGSSAYRHISSPKVIDTAHFQLSVPGMGEWLKLILSAREHLVSFIHKSKYKEIPVYLLRERWDGGIPSEDAASRAKKYRGEFAGVLPARTRKWKQFFGMSFDWILAECLGAGMIELFETGSVGRAARLP